MGNNISATHEAVIVALLARGETWSDIKLIMERDYGRHVSSVGINSVRKRNLKTIEDVKTRTIAKMEADSQALRNQANRTIKRQLDNVEKGAEILAHAGAQYLNDEITLHQYTEIIKHVKTASLTELVSVSKEMHAQTGAAPGAVADPETQAAIRKALEEGDEVTLTQLVFNKSAAAQPESKKVVIDGQR